MDEEQHRTALKTICRLCGSHDSRRLVPKVKLCGIIKRSLKFDISTDEEVIHPPNVCEKCERKLKRWNIKNNKKSRTELNITLHQFQEHNEKCSLCTSEGISTNSWYEHITSLAQARGLTGKVCKNGKTLVMSIDDEGNSRWCLFIAENGAWSVKVYGRQVKEDLFVNVPTNISLSDHLKIILDQLLNLNVCIGNPEYFLPQSVLQNRPVYLHHSASTTTIRHTSCPLLTKDAPRCNQCRLYRSDLSKLHHRFQVINSPALKANHRYISNRSLSKRLSVKKSSEKKLMRRVKNLEKQAARSFKDNAVSLEKEQHESFSTMLLDESQSMTEHFGVNTPMRLLWNEQKKSLSRKKSGMRWHPAVLRLCIALHAKSPSAYNLLRDSGFLSLPHQRSLKHYTSFTSNPPGINPEVISRIIQDIGLENMKNHQRNISVSFDEMKICEGLVYSHSSGEVIGFTSLGSLNDELDRYTRHCKEKNRVMASHVLTVMIRGICASYKAAIGYFATTGATSDQLYNIFMKSLEILELYGFSVRALVCDGAASNRGAYELLCSKEEGSFFFTSPFSGRKIYLFSDVPHLMKTSRNNLENSGYNNKSRNMMFRGLSVTWKHILDVYEWDQHSSGLRMLHRLTNDHLYPSPAQRMKVKLAAQVLSESVANALKVQGKSETASTELFVRYMDQFFDCLNVSRLGADERTRKSALAKYEKLTDWRFVFLEEEFLSFLDEWETEGRLTGLPASQREKLCLSRQTLDGLKMTVKSFVMLAKEMLQEPGVQFILSEKFSQDPLEEYFSKQRGMGGRHDNPTVKQFGSNMTTLHVAGDAIRSSKRANVQASGSSSFCSDPIPRKRLFKNK